MARPFGKRPCNPRLASGLFGHGGASDTVPTNWLNPYRAYKFMGAGENTVADLVPSREAKPVRATTTVGRVRAKTKPKRPSRKSGKTKKR